MSKYLSWLSIWFIPVLAVLFGTEAAGNERVETDPRLECIAELANDVYWSSLKRQPNFYIEYVGSQSDFRDKFANYFKKYKIHGKGVKVTLTSNWDSRNKILYPNLIFVSSSAMHYAGQISTFFKNYPVLIVTEQSYWAKGWMASLQPKDEDIHGVVHEWSYVVDPENIKTYAGLTVSTRLLAFSKKATHDVNLAVKPTPKKKKVDYASLLRERNDIIAQRESTIVLLEDTIVRQRVTIDSLSYRLSLVRYDAFSEIRPGLLWEVTTDTDVEPTVKKQRISTAPWGNNVVGLTIFAVLGLLSVSSVLILSALSPVAVSGTGLSHNATLAAMGTVAVAATENKKHSLEESFLGNVSHELRTPLNAIVGLSQYVATSHNVDDEVRESLEIINTNAHGLMQMMNNILMLSMLQRNEVVLEREMFEFYAFMKAMHESTLSYLQSLKRNDLQLTYETSICATDGVFIDCDIEKLRMLFELLLSLMLINTSVRTVSLGGLVKSQQECVLYLRASKDNAMKKLQLADFLFDESHKYQKSGLNSEISLDTVQGLLNLMGTQLYRTVGGVEQMYYFCMHLTHFC